MSHTQRIDVAWDVVETFVRDWQIAPYRWNKEIDVQVEIASRLSTVLRALGQDTYLANYANAVSGFERNQQWSCVSCEPPCRYTFADGKQYPALPDVVLWGDIDDPDRPPDAIPSGSFPITWACEIKYGARPQVPRQDGEWDDQEKLTALIREQKVQFGCCLSISRCRTRNELGVLWNRDLEDGRLWICDAQLPAVQSKRDSELVGNC